MEKKLYELKINEELDSLFPKLDEQENSLLEKSILEDGCTDPIITWNGVIVDGHNRYRICHKHNIPFAVEEREFSDIASAMEWMISRQLGRRNLTNFMKAKVALRYETEFRKQAEQNKKAAVKLDTDLDANERRTDSRLGKLVGLSRDTIAKSRKLDAEADAETKAKLDAGTLSVNKAFSNLDGKKNSGQKVSFRHPLPDDVSFYTRTMDMMFKDQGNLCEQWGEAVKDSVKDQQLAGRLPNWAATYYSFSNAMAAAGRSIGEKKRKTGRLSSEEKKLIKGFDKLLETLDAGVKESLDGITPFSVHQELFVSMMRKLKDAYINSSAEIFSYLWDVEQMKTQRFGSQNNDGSFDEMLAELKTKNE